MMNQPDHYPDLSKHGYQILHQLSKNQDQSCITWQGIVINSKIPVAIEQFRFATQDSSWGEYQAYQQEIELLKKFKNPGIPKYLDSFETEKSFCFVREYVVATSLAAQTEVTEKKLKIIAVKTLEILFYLQQQEPPILHLNITPENILLDSNLNVYLIDFSLAQKANTQLIPNSFKIKNAEFIAPEQFKAPCQASDLYGLGQTLINVINKQQSLALTKQDDFDYLENCSFFSTLDGGFQNWLNTMIEPDLTKRYVDAENALKALKINSWDEFDSVIKSFDKIALTQQKFYLGIGAIAILSFAIAFAFNLMQQVTESSLVNITIILMGTVIIYLTQSASAILITNDSAEQKQVIFVAISVPIILAIITGTIFGKGEAVAISLSAIIAQTATLGLVLWQKLPLDRLENILKRIAVLIAIACGLISGIAIF
jgi:serine/threonine protein kinase